MRAVIFGAGHQHHPAQHRRRGIDRAHRIDQHVAVRRDVGGIARGGAGGRGKRRVEDVCRFSQAGELRGRGLAVQQVDADVAVARGGLGLAARQADDGPVAFPEQSLDDVASDDAERTDHDGLFALWHACSFD